MARAIVTPPPCETREAAMCRRAFRFRRRGDQRKAMLLLREAAHVAERDPKVWVLYGAQCMRTGRVDEAERAFSHAAWLRERAHETRKARLTRALVSVLSGTRAA
jgi:Flp pilus assembly protein TadD